MRLIKPMCLMTLMSLMSLMFPAPAFAGELANQFTISLYVNPQTSIASKALMGKAEEVRLFTDASGLPSCQIKSTTWQIASNATSQLPLNTWSHIACTYDKAVLRLYVNGVQAGTSNLTVAVDDTANNFLVGQDSSSDALYTNFIGTVDQFQVYNYARSAKQVVEDLNAGHPAVGSPVGSAVGHWKFDEGVGTTANNSGSQGLTLQGLLSGFASPATSTSGWTQSGKFGKALNFDNTDDVVTVTANTAINNLTTRTLSAWIYPRTSGEGTYGRIFAKEDAGSTAGWTLGMGASNNKIAFTEYFGSIGRWDSPANSITVNQWNHVVVTFDSSSNSNDPLIYINGKSVTVTEINTPSAGSRSDDSSYNLLMGNRSSGDRTFDGLIDELKIYNYALTSDEVKLDYNRGSSMVLGSLSDNSSYQTQAANQEYCVPGDTSSTCAAPVGRWDFEEGSGTSAKDTSGNANNGTWYGTGATHWTNGKYGKAGNFNGNDDYVNTTGPAFADNDTAFTLAAWVKTTTAGIILSSIQGTDDDAWFYIGIAGGKARFNTYDTDTRNLDSTADINDNKWHYIVATFDTTSGKKLYLDGRLENSNAAHTAIGGTTNHFHIGSSAYLDVVTNYFPGQIDQVRIFNYARTAAQVAWDYNRGAPVGHWKFDECQGSVANDSSGNSNTGTITIGASGTQTAVGTCTGSANTAWKDGATGKINYSLDFDGTDDYVSVSDPSSGILDFGDGTPFSVFGWFKSSDTTSEMYLVDKRTGGANAAGYVLLLDQDATNYWGPADGTNNAYFTNTDNYSDGNWHHMGFTWDGTSVTTAYMDGKAVGTTTRALGSLANTSDLYLGRHAANTVSFWNGQIDDVKVFNYALTPLQIKLLYNDGSVRFGPSTGAP